MPMLHAGRDPHGIAGPDLLNGAVPVLHAADTRYYDQRLTERMRVPGGARSRLEGDGSAACPSLSASLEPILDAGGADEIPGRSDTRGLPARASDHNLRICTGWHGDGCPGYGC